MSNDPWAHCYVRSGGNSDVKGVGMLVVSLCVQITDFGIPKVSAAFS